MPIRRRRSVSRSKSTAFDGWLHERDARFVMKLVLWLCLLMLPFIIVWGHILQISAGLAFGAFMGYAVTPDADHMAMTHEEYRAMRKWGFFGALLVAYMTPYAFTFSHRSKASHSIFPGTPIRIVWVTWLLLILAIYLAIEFGLIWSLWYWAMIPSWALQDMFHYRRDNLGWLGLRDRRVPRRA